MVDRDQEVFLYTLVHNDALHRNDEGPTYKVGFHRPPLHTQFKPGVSGNPSGRPKDSKNFKTLLHSILNEQISLQEGSQSRKISKAEAIMRRHVDGFEREIRKALVEG